MVQFNIKEIEGVFIEKIQRVEGVFSFRFTPSEKFDFNAGQFLQVIFDLDDRSNKDLNKYLSFSCSPKCDYIEVTKKISESTFSKKLLALKVGDPVLFKGPMGNCLLNGDESKVGFLVGGIGVTPVISILEDLIENKKEVDIVLLYSNWTAKDVAFRDQLDAWSSEFKHIRVVHTLVTCDEGDTSCFVGMIDDLFVKEQMNDFLQRHLFVFGPPGMVNAMKDLCNKLGCDKALVKMETFMGY